MQPIEKANQLMDSFTILLGDESNALAAANKCTDEVIEVLKTVNPNLSYPPPTGFWEQVKEELEKF